MFKKLVAIEPIGLVPSAEDQLKDFATEVILHDNLPSGNEEIAARIGDADAVLLSYTTYLGAEALEKCAHVKYIGMCCSLYSPESANVDIAYAKKRGITVTGIRDYGDEGVVEYVISELVRCLHGFGHKADGSKIVAWSGEPREMTELKVGIIGLGKLGGMIADALHFLGADISYFSRSEKQEAHNKGYRFKVLNELLTSNEVVISCLNKNTVLLHKEQFQHLGNNKILFNVGLSPAWDAAPFNTWINGDNRLYCDSNGALGNDDFLEHPNVYCMGVSSGRTREAFVRLSEKVLSNISDHLKRR
ncbi:NAD(P)-dependent oxidoreductase [Geofilum rubicundum]|nr:NAD(P)-dependent oxidoreductase [Geofilum rubicundum]